MCIRSIGIPVSAILNIQLHRPQTASSKYVLVHSYSMKYECNNMSTRSTSDFWVWVLCKEYTYTTLHQHQSLTFKSWGYKNQYEAILMRTCTSISINGWVQDAYSQVCTILHKLNFFRELQAKLRHTLIVPNIVSLLKSVVILWNPPKKS